MSVAGILGNLHRDCELMSERRREGGRMDGWMDGTGNEGEFVKKGVVGDGESADKLRGRAVSRRVEEKEEKTERDVDEDRKTGAQR